MAKAGEIVLLKSGGPNMVVLYVFGESEGTRDKTAAMKGFTEGDCLCEWQHQIGEDKFKTYKESFKASMLMYPDGKAL